MSLLACVSLTVCLFALSVYAVDDTVDVEFVPIRLALKQRDIGGLEAALYAVASPESTTYGQHLSAHDVAELVGTSHLDIARLRIWLRQHEEIQAQADSVYVHATRDYIDVSVPKSVAYEMVGDAGQRQRVGGVAAPGLGGRFASHAMANQFVEFAIFIDAKHNTALRVADEAGSEFAAWQKLPSRAERQHTYAQSQTKKNDQNRMRTMSSADATAPLYAAPSNGGGTPAAQRAAYGVPADLVCTNKTNHQMVWGTGSYGFTPSDLAAYYAGVDIPAAESDLLIVTDFAGRAGGDNWGEGTLDVSVISGLAPGVVTLVSNTDTSSGAEEGDGFGPAMLKWLSGLVDNSTTKGLPGVISLSLGSLSWDSCNLLCTGVATAGKYTFAQCFSYMQNQRQVCMFAESANIDRMNTEIMKLSAMGVSVIAATGDGGSHFSFQFFNSDPMGTALNAVACKMNSPTFPSESPYVTGVGGTAWTNGPDKPVGWSASGGGWSWRFPRPAYQDQAVKNYYATASSLPPHTAYNSSNRAYPDVAALAENVPVMMGGSWRPLAGTSCAAPEFSALISLINDQRLNAGLTTLGWLNPVLYGLSAKPNVYPKIFYDMSTGNSDCDGNGECCNEGTGFPANIGWDPTTGLGSPLFAGLAGYLGTNEFIDLFQ